MSLNYLPATVSNLIATLEPALAAVLAYFLLGEHLSDVQVIGSACILTGVILLRMGRKHKLSRQFRSRPPHSRL
jgi:drug/metabolite transporter (DMT)-like permease